MKLKFPPKLSKFSKEKRNIHPCHQAGTDINVRDFAGRSALDQAAQAGYGYSAVSSISPRIPGANYQPCHGGVDCGSRSSLRSLIIIVASGTLK